MTCWYSRGSVATAPKVHRRNFIVEVWDGEQSRKLRNSFKNHTFLKENVSCNYCSYAFAQEKSSLTKIVEGLNLKIKRYKSAHKVVDDGKVLETPESLIPLNKIEEYRKMLKKENSN